MNNDKKYGIPEELSLEIAKENKVNNEEFKKDLESYFENNFTKNLINIETKEDLIKLYYNYLTNHPNEWIIISDIFNPSELNSNNLLFEIIYLLKYNYNFEKKYNKLRIIE